MKRPWLQLLAMILACSALDCRATKKTGQPAHAEDDAWSVTAWGKLYEVFAETDRLIAGQAANSNPHITILEGFQPLKTGKVSVVLRGTGADQIFEQAKASRDGIFPVEIRPKAEGDFDLLFRIDGPAGVEEIPAGRVHVGTPNAPGAATDAGPDGAAEGISFPKEQQWRTAFGTAWVAESTLAESVSGPGRITAAAGGEVMLTAAVNAAIASKPWPFPGLDVERGKPVMRLLPRIAERSLPDLQAEHASLKAEVDTARRRVERLTELLKVEATSTAELERARASLSGLEARLHAAQQGVSSATGSGGTASGITVSAPWSGQVAEVLVSPGQTVSAGAPLARVVKVRPLWVIVALRPEDAARVVGEPSALLLRRSGSAEHDEIDAKDLRVVSRSPEVDPRTASLDLIIEVNLSVSELPLGSTVEAELLLGGGRQGIVIPASALVDDGGVTVAYAQLEGESFQRKEIRVITRQGQRVLVEGLEPGTRLVTQGGGAIRRSALLSTGASEAHVH
jgi:RND family efflux transporter MFP subunit